jgi:hypothetical protein
MTQHAPDCDSFDFDPEEQLGTTKPCNCGAAKTCLVCGEPLAKYTLDRYSEEACGPFCGGRLTERRFTNTLVAALVAKAGGAVALTDRDLVDSLGLALECDDKTRTTGGRTYRTCSATRKDET